MTSETKRERAAALICLAALFGALFLLCWWFPLVGDDWYREVLGASLHSPLDLFSRLVQAWRTTNARVLGNLLAYAAGSRPLFRALLRALFTLALAALLARLAGLKSWRGLLLCAAGVLALPREMFCQIYPWAAGFFNYLPPVVLLLAALILVEPVLEGKPLEERLSRWTALFLLGFGQQLFMEHNTLCALCAAAVLLIWYWWERRKLSPALLAFFAGCILGGALMFLSPCYGLIGQAGGAYQLGNGGGLSGLIATARVNLREVAQYYIIACPALYWSLTALALALWRREKRGPADAALAAVLILGCLGLAWGRFKPLAVAIVWGLAYTAVLWRWTGSRAARAKALFLWLSAAVAAGPLLVVNPIGPRCLFASYVLLLGAAGVLLRSLGPEALPGWIRTLVPAAAAAGVLCFYLAAFHPLHQLELLRARELEGAVAANASGVVLPAYEDRGFLWDADSGYKMELFYYRERPGDLNITFVPRGEWEARYG